MVTRIKIHLIVIDDKNVLLENFEMEDQADSEVGA